MDAKSIKRFKGFLVVDEKTGRFILDKGFAEANLTPQALACGFIEKDGNYIFTPFRSAIILAYELPQLYPLTFPEIVRFLLQYGRDYIDLRGLNDQRLFDEHENHRYQEIYFPPTKNVGKKPKKLPAIKKKTTTKKPKAPSRLSKKRKGVEDDY